MHALSYLKNKAYLKNNIHSHNMSKFAWPFKDPSCSVRGYWAPWSTKMTVEVVGTELKTTDPFCQNSYLSWDFWARKRTMIWRGGGDYHFVTKIAGNRRNHWRRHGLLRSTRARVREPKFFLSLTLWKLWLCHCTFVYHNFLVSNRNWAGCLFTSYYWRALCNGAT